MFLRVLGCLSLFFFCIYGQTFQLDGLRNCTEVPATVEQIESIAVIVSGLDASLTYSITPTAGAVMYWPGNSGEPYDHYAWSIAVTPENCGMGTSSSPPLCGSTNQETCCWYSTARLGAPPPLLHANNNQTAFEQVSSNSVQIRGQTSVWVWFEDDNCSNNQGVLEFTVSQQ